MDFSIELKINLEIAGRGIDALYNRTFKSPHVKRFEYKKGRVDWKGKGLFLENIT